ncbi:hypothetical protein BDR26DRAFT_853412, partial [Obelidium mucronatum]
MSEDHGHPSFDSLREIISWSSLGFGLLQTAFFLGFVFLVELKNAKRAKEKQFATPFNLLLLCGSFAELIVSVSMALAVTRRFFMIPASIALSVAEACYINYSWLRSAGIVQEEFPPFVSVWMERLVKSSSLVFLIQAIPDISIAVYGGGGGGNADPEGTIKWPDIFHQACLVVVGGVVTVFDTVLITAFWLFLRKTNVMEQGIDQHFVIIAKTGFVCCCVCYVELGLALASVVLFPRRVGLLVRSVCYAVGQFLLTPLILMKVQLYWHKKKEYSTGGG